MLVTKKVSKNIDVIARIKHCVAHKILLSLYYTLIFPYFSYCNIIWGSNYKTHLYNLFSKNGLLGLYVTCPVFLVQRPVFVNSIYSHSIISSILSTNIKFSY